MHAAYLLQWPDSELASLTEHPPGTVCLRFSAAACRRVDDGLVVVGYLRPLELWFEGAIWHADGPALGCIAEGGLRLDGQPVGSVAQAPGVPLPLDCRGRVICTLRLVSGTALRVEAGRAVARIADAACFHESCAC